MGSITQGSILGAKAKEAREVVRVAMAGTLARVAARTGVKAVAKAVEAVGTPTPLRENQFALPTTTLKRSALIVSGTFALVALGNMRHTLALEILARAQRGAWK